MKRQKLVDSRRRVNRNEKKEHERWAKSSLTWTNRELKKKHWAILTTCRRTTNKKALDEKNGETHARTLTPTHCGCRAFHLPTRWQRWFLSCWNWSHDIIVIQQVLFVNLRIKNIVRNWFKISSFISRWYAHANIKYNNLYNIVIYSFYVQRHFIK